MGSHSLGRGGMMVPEPFAAAANDTGVVRGMMSPPPPARRRPSSSWPTTDHHRPPLPQEVRGCLPTGPSMPPTHSPLREFGSLLACSRPYRSDGSGIPSS